MENYFHNIFTRHNEEGNCVCALESCAVLSMALGRSSDCAKRKAKLSVMEKSIFVQCRCVGAAFFPFFSCLSG